jgi:hypothetical protein
MAYVPTWKERLEEAKVYRGPAIAGVVVLVMAGWLGWHFFGPEAAQKPLTAPPKEEAARLAAVERVAAEVTVLENTYRRAVESGASEQTTRAMLDQVLGVFGVKPEYDLNLMLPGQTLFQSTSRMMAALGAREMAARPFAVVRCSTAGVAARDYSVNIPPRRTAGTADGVASTSADARAAGARCAMG